MQTKLTIEHLSCYLPYGLKVKDSTCPKANITRELSGIVSDGNRYVVYTKHPVTYWMFIEECKPILRPLSDLDKEIPWNFKGEDFGKPVKFSNKGFFRADTSKPYEWGNITNGNFNMQGQLNYFKYLYAHHFDMHGLIDSGLAISIHDLKGEIY